MADLEVDYCVVGAGFAGLTAALRLKQAGQSVALLEARDRTGGRTFTVPRGDGTWIDRGGAWIGPGQDGIYKLMAEFGVPSYDQHTDGEAMMVVDGKQHRYEGTIPLSMNPWTVANIGGPFLELEKYCKQVPREAPWEMKDAETWDAMSVATWLKTTRKLSPAAHQLLEAAVAGLYTASAAETSMLFVLMQMASAGGPNFVLGVKGGAEDQRPVGGMGAIYGAVADELGDSLHLSQPVRTILQDGDGVTVRSGEMAVKARRVVVAVPIAIGARIDYHPLLPFERDLLHQRMPLGPTFKTSIVYDEPFWRRKGLSGQSFGPGTAVGLSIDASTDKPTPGMMCVINEGPNAARLQRMGDADRRQATLDQLADRFGDEAQHPVDYDEQAWHLERYTGGGMITHMPPGVLTQFGHTLRPPCGRVHWAGTESSSVMYGFIDGAIRSGERAAAEVMQQDGAG
jgi:monoamine oxidase